MTFTDVVAILAIIYLVKFGIVMPRLRKPKERE